VKRIVRMVVHLMRTTSGAAVLGQNASAKCNIGAPYLEFQERPDGDFIRTRRRAEVGDFYYKHLISCSARSV